MKNKKTIVIILAIVVVIITAGFITLTVLTRVDENSICENVYIDSLNVGNMSREQAKEALDAYIEELKQTQVIVNVGENRVTTSLDEIGVTVDESGYLEKALEAGKHGSLFTRYKELRKIKNNKLVYPLSIGIEEGSIDKLVDRCKQFEIKARNAVITRENGEFRVSDAIDGLTLDQEMIRTAIKEDINNWNKVDEIVIDAPFHVEKAKVTKENALLCNTIIGSFSTSFASSSASRKKNVKNGASKIDGVIIYPGEEFSAATTMGPFDETNGYELAGSYLNGKTIESFGGGVCQVSTTLYNALLWSELTITQRASHSMTVSYVKPGMDAAISGTSKDLKFKNNTDAPIYIQAYASNTTLTFNIWGHETRARNRRIEFVSEVESTVEPGEDVITEDPTLPMTYSKVESHAHTGCKAYLYKVIYVDGIEQSKDKVNYSSYAASPNYITIGTKVVDDQPNDASGEQKDPNKKEIPVVPATPAPTPVPTENPVTIPTETPKANN